MVAPIPSASVITAVVVNPGAFLSWRSASLKSASTRVSILCMKLKSYGSNTGVCCQWFPNVGNLTELDGVLASNLPLISEDEDSGPVLVIDREGISARGQGGGRYPKFKEGISTHLFNV